QWIQIISIGDGKHIVRTQRLVHIKIDMQSRRIVKHSRIAQEYERVGTNVYTKYIDTRDHGCKAELRETHHRHHGCFPSLRGLDHNESEHAMPNAPQQEAAFLSFPETTQQVFEFE